MEMYLRTGTNIVIEEAKTITDVPLRTATIVPVDWLVLDRENPRLISVDQMTTEAEIIAQLYRSEELGELLQSIAANGYMDIEPLIVITQNNAHVVLEGNRRLAAINLFRKSQLVEEVNEVGRVKIKVPEISADRRETFDKVTVYRVANREDARSFIGFKHINGAAKWESYAKAKFAADWYRKGEVSLSDIAERIGDKHDTIKRMVNAIYVLEQAEESAQFRLNDRMSPRFNFSHLYTALSRATYMDFLGLKAAWTSYDPGPNPISNEKLHNLGEVLRWIYGSKEEDVEPIIQSQNPDIKNLGLVLINSEGLAVLRASGSLTEAHASIQPAGEKLTESLLRARTAMREASNSLRGFDGRDQALIDIAEDISETAQAIYARMRKKKLETDDTA